LLTNDKYNLAHAGWRAHARWWETNNLFYLAL